MDNVELLKRVKEAMKNKVENNLGLYKHLAGPRQFIPKQPGKYDLKKIMESIPQQQYMTLKINPFIVNTLISSNPFKFPLPPQFIHEPPKNEYDISNITIVNLMLKEDMEFIFNAFINDKLKELPILGTGSYGRVYGYKEYAIKVFTSNSDKDYEFLECLNDISLFPKLYCYYPKKFMVSEKINGITLAQLKDNIVKRLSFINNVNIVDILKDLQRDIQKVNNLKIGMSDLHSSNIMITNNNKVKVVDVGGFWYNGSTDLYRLNEEIFLIYNTALI